MATDKLDEVNVAENRENTRERRGAWCDSG
jgi:hypothetical protein